MFTIKEFPGRRFASMEEADRAIKERERYTKFLKRLGEKLSFFIYRIKRVSDVEENQEEETKTKQVAA